MLALSDDGNHYRVREEPGATQMAGTPSAAPGTPGRTSRSPPG
ncbi:hypothetical protein SAZ11_55230 [Streptomyces sp. FXJ1.4098]|nr:hypothetical protein [Streptomyces sp. FXJ1.4098]